MSQKNDKEHRSLMGRQDKPEVRKAEGEPTKIVGYAVRWDAPSSPIGGMFVEKFSRGAFAAALTQPDVYASWQHDEREILGRTPNTLTIVEDEIGLRYEITPPSWADKYVESIERGDVRGSSFIFRATKQDWDETNPDMMVRTVTEAELFEVSPVTLPAYPQSTAGIRSAKDVHEEHIKAVMEEKRQQDEANAAIALVELRRRKLKL
jgi:HK97 family phage prohead protease